MNHDDEPDRSTQSWLHRHWRMAVIVVVASVVAFYSFRYFNWLAGISAIAIGLGVLMNVAVMLANSGRMPVDTDDDISEEPSSMPGFMLADLFDRMVAMRSVSS